MRKFLASLGAGGASVDTQLERTEYRPGELVRGQVQVLGGTVAQDVERIVVKLLSRAEVEAGDNEFAANVSFAQQQVWGAFRLDPGARYAVPFELALPFETPITAYRGYHMRGMAIGVGTEVQIAKAVDKGDLDPITVHPLPAQQAILDAVVNMGFRFKGADCETGYIRGVHQTLPFYQEIEFAAPPQLARQLSELELTFVAGPRSMEVVLEMDKRGGVFTAGGDVYDRFTVPFGSEASTNWAQVMEQRLQGLLHRRPHW